MSSCTFTRATLISSLSFFLTASLKASDHTNAPYSESAQRETIEKILNDLSLITVNQSDMLVCSEISSLEVDSSSGNEDELGLDLEIEKEKGILDLGSKTTHLSKESLSDKEFFPNEELVKESEEFELDSRVLGATRANTGYDLSSSDGSSDISPFMGVQDELQNPVSTVDALSEEGDYPVYEIEEKARDRVSASELSTVSTQESSPYASQAAVSTVQNSSGFAAAAVMGSSGGFSMSAESSPSQAEVRASVRNYEVDGTVKLTSSDNLVFGNSLISGGFELNIVGTDIVLPDGSIDYATLDGDNLYRGFFINYTGVAAGTKAEVNLKGVNTFQNFTTTGSTAYGGVFTLYKGGTLNFGEERVTFINNHSITSSTGSASGGVLYVEGGGVVSDINADFINNSSGRTATAPSTSIARGGAIAVADLTRTGKKAVIGDINGLFQGNESSHGGAIYVGTRGQIGNVSGSFIGNTAMGAPHIGSTTGGANGGAIRVWEGSIGNLDATFRDNICYSISGGATGGAVALDYTEVKGGITGHYENNTVFSGNSSAQGGAYSLKNQIAEKALVFTNTDFIGNAAGSAAAATSTAKVQGGAFYIENSADVFFIADGEDVLMSDNYTIKGAFWNSTTNQILETTSSVKTYNAIYAKDSTVYLQTTAGKSDTITINDSIMGEGSSILVVDAAGDARYDVIINDAIGLPQLVIENGGVELGTYSPAEGEDRVGRFSNEASLTIHETGILKANANSLDNVGDVTLHGTSRDNAGVLEFTGGTLNSNINKVTGTETLESVRTGHIDILGKTTFAQNNVVNADTINVRDTLSLMENTTVNVNTLLFHGYNKDDVNNGGNQIVMDTSSQLSFSTLELHFAEANPGDLFNLIVSNDGVGIVDIDWTTTTIFALAGKYLEYGTEYVVHALPDGGVQVEILIRVDPPIPEPATATLSIIALMGLLGRRRRRL